MILREGEVALLPLRPWGAGCLGCLWVPGAAGGQWWAWGGRFREFWHLAPAAVALRNVFLRVLQGNMHAGMDVGA